MKITDIKTIILHYPYKQWIADGCGSCGARGAFLILIETDTELCGIGEAATFWWFHGGYEKYCGKAVKTIDSWRGSDKNRVSASENDME
ncbi:MAG: hypothetical protein ACLR1V_14135 [Coprococcus sp.]